LIGIGVEKLGVEDFIRGKFFSGELFIDESRASYQALGFAK
jgi:prostamide/prostaglandin F2alpha synthase